MSNDFIQNAVNALYQSNELMALKAENARLKAEVERLTSAGDCLVIHIEACYREKGYDPKDCDMIDNWDAAKGGQP